MKIICAYCKKVVEGDHDFCPACGEHIYIGTEAAKTAKKKRSKVKYYKLETESEWKAKQDLKEQFIPLIVIAVLAVVLTVLSLLGII